METGGLDLSKGTVGFPNPANGLAQSEVEHGNTDLFDGFKHLCRLVTCRDAGSRSLDGRHGS